MNKFEEACDAIEKKEGYDEYIEGENVIEWLRNAKTATVSFSQPRFINKIKALAEKFPEMVEITHEQAGALVAHIPVSAVKINIVIPREMSEEEKEAARQRLAKYREKQANEDTEDMEEDIEIEEVEETETSEGIDEEENE